MDELVMEWQKKVLLAISKLTDKEMAVLYCKLNCWEWDDMLPECEYSLLDHEARMHYQQDDTEDKFDYNWWIMGQILRTVGARIISKTHWKRCDLEKINGEKWEEWYNRTFSKSFGHKPTTEKEIETP